MEDQKEKQPGQTVFKRIIWHPLFGIAVGAVIAAYFYYAGIKKPNLTYYVSPTRTAIVQKNNLNNFDVTLNGMQVRGELSSAEIQIWNEGGAPIHHDDILKTVCLKTQNGEPIIQTTLKTTRDVVGFKLLNTTNQLNILPMDWKVLERNDGVKLQVIYGGDVNVQFKLDGVIEGQGGEISEYAVTDLNEHRLFWAWGLLYGVFYLSLKVLFKRIPAHYIQFVNKRFSVDDAACMFFAVILIAVVNVVIIKPGHGLHAMPPFGL